MTRRVVLVVGPPAAGKSSWVERNAGAGDTVVDFDAIAQSLGSGSSHDHANRFVSAAVAEQSRMERRVATMTEGTAYVIRAEPDPHERDEIARRVRATDVVVVDPGRQAVMSRMADRPERSRRLADDWYRLNKPPPAERAVRENPKREKRYMSTEETPSETPKPTPPPSAANGETKGDHASLPDDHPLVKTLAAQKDEIRELKAKATRLDEIEEAEKSEIERITESYEKTQFELRDAQNALVRERIARKHGLPDELAELLPSGDEEQVEAKAKYLSTLVNDPVRLPDPSQGSTSTNQATDKDAMARALFGG